MGIALLAFTAGCREGGTSTTLRPLEVLRRQVDFQPAYPGTERVETLEVRNPGRSEQRLHLGALEGPFRMVDPPPEAGPGSTLLRLAFAPTVPGIAEATLTIQGELGSPVAVALKGDGKPIPPCPTAPTCTEELFDVRLEACVRHTLPDSTACNPNNACVRDSACQGGVCRGTPITCNDQNACTLDVCNPLDGCHFLPAPPCPGDGRCQLGACDPQLGCLTRQAPDGTLCELDPTCDSARICIAGSCEERDPPDGFVCRKASPCQAEGRCQGSTCVQPPPIPMAPEWSWDAAAQTVAPELHDFVLEPGGRISLSGWFETPVLRANTPEKLSPPGYSRRCILWNDRVVCLDYPWRFDQGGSVQWRQGTVAMLELDTASLLWLYDLPRERPDFVRQTENFSTLFLARVAVLASDRFAILFEGYPLGTNNPNNPAACRNYFLVLLDARGRMVSADKLEDPFLTRCDHPHPFGFSSDVDGSLYIHFSPSLPGSAPLTPVGPGLLMSFTREGQLRWKREEPWVGGEIAVAQGVLYPERGNAALDSATGARRSSIPFIGRAVASADRLVTGPELAGGQWRLSGLDSQLAPRWSSSLPAGDAFTSSEIRLARWQPRAEDIPETVALGFGLLQGTSSLLAVRALDGRQVFSCPLEPAFRGLPNQFEVEDGHLALMSGAQTCGQCDPPYAHSSAMFSLFRVPTLFPTLAPWPGTFAGPSHDGHEKVLYPPPPPQGRRDPRPAR